MRIAFVVDKFPVLSETFILDQITGLIDLGHDVEIFAQSHYKPHKVHPDVTKYRLVECLHYPQTLPSSRTARFIRALCLLFQLLFKHPLKTPRIVFVFLFYYRKLSLLKFLLRLAPFLDGNFHIIHCHYGPNGVFGVSIKHAGIDVKLVTTFHGYDANRYPLIAGKDVYHRLFKYGALFTTNTNFTKQQIIKLRCDEKKIKILPVGLKIERFAFSPAQKTPDKPINILTVARLVEKKGHEYAIRALAKVLEKHTKISYFIAGDGPLMSHLKSLVCQLHLENHVKFVGPVTQDEVLDLYHHAHIFILPSVTARDGDMEGQGLVLQEAQAVGLPVISTRHNGIPDGVLDGQSGFLVPEKDSDALAQKLEFLIEQPQTWPKMGRIGHDFVKNNFDIKVLNQRLAKFYQDLLQPK